MLLTIAVLLAGLAIAPPTAFTDTLYPSSTGLVGRHWLEHRQYFVYNKSSPDLLYMAPPSGPDDHYEGWLKFPLAGMPDTIDVQSATLHFYQYEALYGPHIAGATFDRNPDTTNAYDLYFSPGRRTCDSFAAPDTGWIAMPIFPDTLMDYRRVFGWIAFCVFVKGWSGRGRAYGLTHGELSPWLEVNYDPPGGVEEGPAMPSRTGMHLAPNPTNSRTLACYITTEESPASLAVHDVTGREVWHTRIEGQRTGTVRFPLLPAGVYLVRFKTDVFTATDKLVVEK